MPWYKRFLTTLLVFGLLLSSLPVFASALTAGEFEYAVNGDGTVTITAYSGVSADVTIPSAIEGMPVTVIGEESFANNLHLQTIAFPDTLVKIESKAFKSCLNLENVSFPESLISIQSQAFFNCNSLTTVQATPYLQSIGMQAFHNTSWYINAAKGPLYIGRVLYHYIGIIPDGTVVTVDDYTASISPSAFENQYNLTKCYLPVGLREIGDYAFASCDRLEYIRIPPSVSYLGSSVFLNSGAVTVHGALESNAHYYSLENEVYFSLDSTLDYLDGDMDKDGEISSSDIRILMKAVLLSEDCDHERFLSCDIVYDGQIKTNDIREWMLLSIA